MRRLISSGGFLAVLLTLALPWVSFGVGCETGLGPQSGASLATGSEVSFTVDPADTAGIYDPVTYSIHIEPQPFVWAAVGVALAGFGLIAVSGRRGYMAQVGVAVLGFILVLAYAGVLSENGHHMPSGFSYMAVQSPESQVLPGSTQDAVPDVDVDVGMVVAALSFDVAAWLAATINVAFNVGFRQRARDRPLREAANVVGYVVVVVVLALGSFLITVMLFGQLLTALTS